MKKLFQEPIMQVIMFGSCDTVIVTSTGTTQETDGSLTIRSFGVDSDD